MRIHDCDLRELALQMGDVSADEARYMRDRLIGLRYIDTDGVPEVVWLDLCREAAQFAQARHGTQAD